MKTFMIIIGWIFLTPVVIVETVIKIIWAVIYCVLRPLFKNMDCNYYLENYAFRWKGHLEICNWLYDKWS